jgi:hypothetical protein
MVTVTVNPPPVITVTAPAILCEGVQTTVICAGALTFTWNTGTLGSSISYTGVVPGTTLIVIGTDANGCESSAVKTISVVPAPTVQVVSSRTVVCPYENAVLTATGAITYSWSNGASTFTTSISPSVTTAYTVTGTNANNCTQVVAFTQSVNPCTGIAQHPVAGKLAIYPNPSSGELTIVTSAEICTFTLFNQLGQQVYILNEQLSGTRKINCGLPPGIYFYEACTKEGTKATGKLIRE